MKRKRFPITNIGSVSLLMIFIVLCMVTFAVLSLSAAISDQKFSSKMKDHTTQYYQASNLAEEKLSEIDSALKTSYKASKDSTSYNDILLKNLASIDNIDIQNTNQQILISCQFPVSDALALKTVFSVNPYGETKDGFYKVISYKEISTKEWKGDDSLNLIH